ncbi:MAG TPA: hypothetical protein VH280_01035, partial [Verrucomicrobiae bacterium]|nr:hypothetical protein [Verrucomicrobiae bacterium]
GSGLFGFWRRFSFSHRVFKHAPSLKPRQNTKNPRSERPHYFLKRSKLLRLPLSQAPSMAYFKLLY